MNTTTSPSGNGHPPSAASGTSTPSPTPGAIMKWVGAVGSVLGLIILIFGMVWAAIAFVENRAERTTSEHLKEISSQISALDKDVKSVKEDTSYLRVRLDAHIDGKAKK